MALLYFTSSKLMFLRLSLDRDGCKRGLEARDTNMDFGITQKKQDELEKRMTNLGIRESDIEEKFVRSSGPGGQKLNKTASCVNLKHIPTGFEIKMQRQRTQRLNRYYARKRLCELIEEQTLGKKSPLAIKSEKIRKQKQRRKRRSKQSH